MSKCDNLDECVAGEEDLNTKNVFSQVLDMVKIAGDNRFGHEPRAIRGHGSRREGSGSGQTRDIGVRSQQHANDDTTSQTSSQRWTVHIFFFLARF